MYKHIINLKNGEEISFPQNVFNVSIKVANNNESLIVKFPFHGINDNNPELYSQSIVKFFTKSEERREKLLEKFLNEAGIEVINNQLFAKEGSVALRQYGNLNLKNIKTEKPQNKITTQDREEQKMQELEEKLEKLTACRII